MNEPFYFVRYCPICEQGRCRVRISTTRDHRMFGCVVCDECEATWLDPSLEQRFRQPNPEVPVCPQSNVQLWGEMSRWANRDDLCLLGWYTSPWAKTEDASVMNAAAENTLECGDKEKKVVIVRQSESVNRSAQRDSVRLW